MKGLIILLVLVAAAVTLGGWDLRTRFDHTIGTFPTWAECSAKIQRPQELLAEGLGLHCTPAVFGLTRGQGGDPWHR
jgi:hypothetical protein